MLLLLGCVGSFSNARPTALSFVKELYVMAEETLLKYSVDNNNAVSVKRWMLSLEESKLIL